MGQTNSVERIELELPPEYVDTMQNRGRLTEIISEDIGPEFQVESIIEDTAYLVSGVPSSRPNSQTISLASGIKASDGGRVAAHLKKQGLTMVDFDPSSSTAVAARVPETTRQVRDRIAKLTKTEPWEIELSVSWAVEGTTGTGRIDAIHITRAQIPQVDVEKRGEFWRQVVANLPGGSSGWTITEDAFTGGVELQYGSPRKLPKMVQLSSLVPDGVKPDQWHSIPLGVGPEENTVGVDLLAGPHVLSVGPTGTGKTILLLTHAINALARGHKIIMIDPTKAGLDFLKIKPWCSAWADDLPSARATIEAVYAEVGRRKQILQQTGEVKWSDLDAETRKKHQVYPTTVIIDEFGSLAKEANIPKSLPKDDPFRKEAEEININKGIFSYLVGNIAREARFAGIHLVIAIQRPDANIISGELRSNLTSSVQLSPPGKPLSREALTMVFAGDTGPQAAEVLAELDDGVSPGLAVTAAEGGSASGFRVGFAKASELPDLLRTVGVPEPTPFEVSQSASEPPPPDFSVIEADSSPVETSLSLEISEEDLEEWSE